MNKNNTALATANNSEMISNLILNGDLSKMDNVMKTDYYNQFCKALNLNPLTKPFQLLKLSGKEVLYATKDCTEQLRKLNGVSVVELVQEMKEGLCITKCKVQDSALRYDIATGAVNIKGISGDALANAIMKSETKAKRRATLSVCGLGMLDESEIETIDNAQKVNYDSKPIENLKSESLKSKEDLIKEVNEAKSTDGLLVLWNANKHLHTDKEVLTAFGDAKAKFATPATPDDLVKPADFDEQKQFNHYLSLLDSATDAKQVEGLLKGFKKDTVYTFLSLESKGQLDGYLARKFPEVKSSKLSVVDEYKTRLNLCDSWDNVLATANDIVKEAAYKALKKADKDTIKKYCEGHLKTKFDLKEENK